MEKDGKVTDFWVIVSAAIAFAFLDSCVDDTQHIISGSSSLSFCPHKVMCFRSCRSSPSTPAHRVTCQVFSFPKSVEWILLARIQEFHRPATGAGCAISILPQHASLGSSCSSVKSYKRRYRGHRIAENFVKSKH
eukprot:5621632-Amphidinium_carterae.1